MAASSAANAARPTENGACAANPTPTRLVVATARASSTAAFTTGAASVSGNRQHFPEHTSCNARGHQDRHGRQSVGRCRRTGRFHRPCLADRTPDRGRVRGTCLGATCQQTPHPLGHRRGGRHGTPQPRQLQMRVRVDQRRQDRRRPHLDHGRTRRCGGCRGSPLRPRARRPHRRGRAAGAGQRSARPSRQGIGSSLPHSCSGA